jgi:hypothetical protein
LVGERPAARPVALKAPPEPECQMTSRLLAAVEHRCLGPPEVPQAERERPERLEQTRWHRGSLSGEPRLQDE